MAQRKRISQTKRKVTKPEKNKEPKNKILTGEMWAIIIVGIGILFGVSFYFDAAGVLGSFLKSLGLGLIGVVAYAVPLVLVIFGLCYLFDRKIKPRAVWFFAGLFACIAAFIHLCSAYDAEFIDCYTLGTFNVGGGVIGGAIIKLLSFAGRWGTGIILFTAVIVLLMILTSFSPRDFIRRLKENYQKRNIEGEKPQDKQEKPEKPTAAPKKPIEEKPLPVPFDEQDFKIISHDQVTIPDVSAEDKPERLSQPENKKSAEELMNEELQKTEANTKKEVLEAIPQEEIAKEIENAKPRQEYRYPTLDLLSKPQKPKKQDKTDDLRENAKKLIETLKSFGVDAKILEVTQGPSVTRYEIQPSAGVKVSKIVNLADDIALNLAALGVRIEAPIPGKAAVGIEIPNQSRAMVTLREVLSSDAFQNAKSKTAFAIGKDISGTPIVSDISKMPHLLIAGTTGSGKSVFESSIILSLLYNASPDEVKLLMIDPKKVEMQMYEGIPHLLIPIVTEPRKAAGALNWAVTEMVNRYQMFSDCGVRNMEGYNEYAEQEGIPKLPSIVIIIDELSDLMMAAPKEVEDSICRLAQMARAAGMHLVIATQRPSVDVITGLIKANIPSRVALKVSNQIDSRTIIDMMGAEKLLGHGDLLFLPVGASKPIRVQGAWVPDDEIRRVVDYIKGDTEPEYDEDIIERIESADKPEMDEDDPGDSDPLLPQAIEMVVDSGQASVSWVQRKLKVGYARAGRIVDQMEARGIVGPHEGSKPRQVLINKAQFYEMMMSTDESLHPEE
ncbi:MAG: DNA translocase FtsK 4TM domain-containing protein [Clostridia bacterium]|nr:DNA translocase FtsK 4TM domain-containing protein [Clostridia bacterium]